MSSGLKVSWIKSCKQNVLRVQCTSKCDVKAACSFQQSRGLQQAGHIPKADEPLLPWEWPGQVGVVAEAAAAAAAATQAELLAICLAALVVAAIMAATVVMASLRHVCVACRNGAYSDVLEPI